MTAGSSLIALLAAAAGVANTSAFTFVAPSHVVGNSNRWRPFYMSDDGFPSDSSSESTVTDVESVPYEPTQTEALVSSVLDELPSSLMSGDLSKEARASINEALLKLEVLNPTEGPTLSPLLNGVWELRYAAGYSSEWTLPSPTRDIALFAYSGGYSPALFALSLAQKLPFVDLGELDISISREQPRIEAKLGVKLFGSENEVVVKCRLDVESDIRFSEVYESATVLGRTVDLPEKVQYSRQLYVTYLDDDILVVRDASGVPEVLVRKEKMFSQNWGVEPSALDDMTPPGEEDLPATD